VLRWVGLGLAAGAIFHPARAQDTSHVRPDTGKLKVPVPPHADSLIRRDSTGAPRKVPLPQPSDTVQPPLAHAPIPRLLRSDGALHYDRAQLFATGSLTLQDLLARVLIATPFSAGYVSAPANVAVAGDFRRTRVFVDGIEYDALDARSNGVVDYSQIPLWSAEDVTIEQTATEVRVHLRTWRVDNTSSYTRVDIGTGDQQLNLYRGFFGKRFGGGQAVQLAAQQYGTTPPIYLGSSADQLGIIGRFGWAGKRYSVDAFATRVSRHRGDIRAYGRIDSLRGVESTRTDAYLRLGVHDPDTSAGWAQIVMSKGTYDYKPSSASTTTTTTVSDTIKRDTTQSQVQYLAAVGVNHGGFRLSLDARIRHADSVTLVTPAITGSYALGGLVVRGSLEGKSADSLSRADVGGEFMLGTLIRAGAVVDRAVDHRTGSNGLTTLGMRSWAGLRLASLWVDGGVIRRDSATLVAPTLLGASRITIDPPAAGLTLRVSGQVWKALFADINALRWNDTAGSIYRPKYQTRSELFIRTTLPDRFPEGHFGLMVSARHEYRSASLIPSGTSVPLRAQGERTISSLVEVRIYSAVISWQVRNIVGARNYQAADYLMPRTTNFYGVRWDFWN
jgi:hypothetical protein